MNAYTFRSYVMAHQRAHFATPKMCVLPPSKYSELHADVLTKSAEIVNLDKNDAARSLLQHLDHAGIPSFFYMGILVLCGSVDNPLDGVTFA